MLKEGYIYKGLLAANDGTQGVGGIEASQSSETAGYQTLLQTILSQEELHTVEEVKDVWKTPISLVGRVFEERAKIENAEKRRKIENYMLRQLINFLYPDKNDFPESVLEIISAGSPCIAMVLPRTQITSVDIDRNIFLNVPYNTMPIAFFKQSKMQKKRERYSEKDPVGIEKEIKEKKLQLVLQSLPNFHPLVADARNLPQENAIYDMVLLQNNVTSGNAQFLSEMARVTKQSGYIAFVADLQFQTKDDPSVYSSKTIRIGTTSYSFLDNDVAKQNGLHELAIPNTLKAYEHLIDEERGDPPITVTSGYCFQVFQKQ